MRTAKIINMKSPATPPNRDVSDKLMVEVITDFDGEENSFYMDQTDKNGVLVDVEGSEKHSNDPDNLMRFGDEITYDKQDFLKKAVFWQGRKFRQIDYSFNGRKV